LPEAIGHGLSIMCLAAQAGFALRVAGWENLRILQGGFEEWKAKGGFDAYKRRSSL